MTRRLSLERCLPGVALVCGLLGTVSHARADTLRIPVTMKQNVIRYWDDDAQGGCDARGDDAVISSRYDLGIELEPTWVQADLSTIDEFEFVISPPPGKAFLVATSVDPNITDSSTRFTAVFNGTASDAPAFSRSTQPATYELISYGPYSNRDFRSLGATSSTDGSLGRVGATVAFETTIRDYLIHPGFGVRQLTIRVSGSLAASAYPPGVHTFPVGGAIYFSARNPAWAGGTNCYPPDTSVLRFIDTGECGPDTDGDGTGDICDLCPADADNDADADGICGNVDNCPTVANSNQADLDGDRVGDLCDPDPDGDGVLDGADNCPYDVNPDQSDLDGDGFGDVCDSDDDGDGVIDGEDACLATTPGQAADAAGCSVAQLCPCSGNAGGGPWKNHGAYVRCVAHTSEDFLTAGLLTEAQRDALVSTAAQTTCGR